VTTPTRRLGPRGRAARGRLLEAAEECFGTAGYAGTTIAEIADRAGLSQAGFYSYFESKDAILTALIRGMLGEVRSAMRAGEIGTEGRGDAELLGIRSFFGWAEAHPHHHRILNLVADVDPEVAKEFYAAIGRPYAERLRGSMAAGEIAAVDPELLSYALMGIGHLLSLRWILWGDGTFPAQLTGDLGGILGGAVGAVPGEGLSR
jgi:AcrR family transcriptional regulator